MLVRPAKTIITSLAKLSATLCWPTRSPSPAATIRVMEMIPQAMPNIVRKVRSLCDHNVRSVSSSKSRKVIESLQYDFISLFQSLYQFRFDTVRDPQLGHDLVPALVSFGIRNLKGRVAVFIVDHRRLRNDEYVVFLLLDDLSVGAHVSLEFTRGVLNGNPHLKSGY